MVSILNYIRLFFSSASAGGICLLVAAVLGVILANSSLASNYFSLLHLPLGPLTFEGWVNDVLMAIFFLLVGLEIKREILVGELNTNAKRLMPTIAACCGVMGPAIVYYLVAGHDPAFQPGWAIPTATDIAFAIGVVSLLGNRVPLGLTVFLTALAVIDDLIAVMVIAVFYTAQLHLEYLGIAALLVALLVFFNKTHKRNPLFYLIPGIALWLSIHESGLHSTMAGVILAMTIPSDSLKVGQLAPLDAWEQALSKWVTFLILPLFGLVNAGVSVGDFGWADLEHPVVLGVALALFFGKQIGVFSSVFLMVKSGLVPMPKHATWAQVYGVALLCGVGFTMSLFVSILAFDPGLIQERAKVGIFIGSIISGLAGYTLLRVLNRREAFEPLDE